MDYLSRLPVQEILPLTAVVGGLSVGAAIVITSIVAHYWAKIRTSEHDMAVKIEMLQKSFGADDIERVINARRLDDEAYLKDRLASKGLDAKTISKILKAG